MRFNRAHCMAAILPVACVWGAHTLAAQDLQAQVKSAGRAPLFLTATNAPANYLAIVNTRTRQTDFIPTGGTGGVKNNGGGVAVSGNLAAVVNFGSSNVTIFVRHGNTMQPLQMIKTASQPVSVAFGHDHLVVLGQTTLESFPVYGSMVGGNDGMVPLLKADKSAGQVVVFDGGAAYTETSGDLVVVPLSQNGAAGVSGSGRQVNLPAAPNNDTPLGMIGRGGNLYATIAHSDLQVLVINGNIVSTAAGPTPFKDAAGNLTHAPCWNALSGQFLYSSDSPGKQLLRYLVSDNNIFYDKPAVARLSGSPTDLDIQDNLLGVIDGGDGLNNTVSLFDIDPEGELTLRFAVKIASPINGAAIIQ